MSVQPVSGPDQLQRAAEVLSKNWILALPTAVASLVLALIVILGVVSLAATIFIGHAAGGGLGSLAGFGTGGLILGVLVLIGFLLIAISQAIVIHASEDAWQGRPVNLAASLNAVLGRMPDLVVAYVISALIMLVTLALCFVVIGFPLVFVAIFFLVYAIPAVVIGREGGVAAVQSSFRLARQDVGTTFIAFIGIVGVSLVAAVLNSIVSHIPLINFVAAFAIGGLATAYSALVSARFYDIVRGAVPLSTGATFAPQPPPPPPDSGPPTVIR